VNRGERLIKFRDSWFSVKSIEVEWIGIWILRVEQLDWEALGKPTVTLTKLRKLAILTHLIRRWAIRFMVERETAQSRS